MQIVRANDLDYQPAAHEDPGAPGALKKVLLQKDDLAVGRVQMINWSKLPAGRAFRAHYHEDMQEVFILVRGHVRITVSDEKADLGPGDAVLVPARQVHSMRNTGDQDVEYVVVGVSSGEGGKTVVV